MKTLSRRTFLRGAVGGATVALGLPLLDAMLGPRQARGAGDGLGPVFGIFFWGGGTPWHGGHLAEFTTPDTWTPTGTGAGYTPSELIGELATWQPSVVTGLTPTTEIPADPGGQSDGHMRGFMVNLTGDRPRPEGFDHPTHTLTALRPTLDRSSTPPCRPASSRWWSASARRASTTTGTGTGSATTGPTRSTCRSWARRSSTTCCSPPHPTPAS
jgi:hypothetical protein